MVGVLSPAGREIHGHQIPEQCFTCHVVSADKRNSAQYVIQSPESRIAHPESFASSRPQAAHDAGRRLGIASP